MDPKTKKKTQVLQTSELPETDNTLRKKLEEMLRNLIDKLDSDEGENDEGMFKQLMGLIGSLGQMMLLSFLKEAEGDLRFQNQSQRAQMLEKLKEAMKLSRQTGLGEDMSLKGGLGDVKPQELVPGVHQEIAAALPVRPIAPLQPEK